MRAWNRVRWMVVLGGVLALGTVVARAGTVNWTAAGAALTLADGTTLDPANSLVILGTFTGINDTDIPAAAANPLTLFASNFNQIDTGIVGNAGVGGAPGVWTDSISGDFSTTLGSFAGKSIYLWTFNNTSIAAATQEGIFKFAEKFPTDPVGDPPGTVDVDLSLMASTGTILMGGPNPGTILTAIGTLPSVHMAAIPEPSSFVLVLGSLALAAKLRRRATR